MKLLVSSAYIGETYTEILNYSNGSFHNVDLFTCNQGEDIILETLFTLQL